MNQESTAAETLEIIEPRLHAPKSGGHFGGEVYHEYTCAQCKAFTANTFSKETRDQMLARRLCFHCNYWQNFSDFMATNHAAMTIIDGHIYTPGDRTTGSFLGMAGRRFDIEYISPSEYAGKCVTTHDLWSGATMPARLRARFPDTARFITGGKAKAGDITCWNPSDRTAPEYPRPSAAGIRDLVYP